MDLNINMSDFSPGPLRYRHDQRNGIDAALDNR